MTSATKTSPQSWGEEEQDQAEILAFLMVRSITQILRYVQYTKGFPPKEEDRAIFTENILEIISRNNVVPEMREECKLDIILAALDICGLGDPTLLGDRLDYMTLRPSLDQLIMCYAAWWLYPRVKHIIVKQFKDRFYSVIKCYPVSETPVVFRTLETLEQVNTLVCAVYAVESTQHSHWVTRGVEYMNKLAKPPATALTSAAADMDEEIKKVIAVTESEYVERVKHYVDYPVTLAYIHMMTDAVYMLPKRQLTPSKRHRVLCFYSDMLRMGSSIDPRLAADMLWKWLPDMQQTEGFLNLRHKFTGLELAYIEMKKAKDPGVVYAKHIDYSAEDGGPVLDSFPME